MFPFLSLLSAAACAQGGHDPESAGLSASGALTLVSLASGAGSTHEDSEDPPGGSILPKFDLGELPDLGGPEPADGAPCVKVDLLFVVDNSSSMEDEQVNLVASFPSFVQEIQQELAHAESLHIGITTTDAYAYNEPPCRNVLGGLVTQTGGLASSAALCGPYASGLRFMSEADDLPARFTCAAQVGIEGDSNEMPIDAALAALGPGLAAPGACSEGFVRDDALLVLVLITDEEEEGSAGTPAQWFTDLVALKGGIETNIVVLSLIGPEHPLCLNAAEIGHRLIDFTQRFTYGIVGRICAPDYQPFFHQAIAGITQACHHFTPPG